MKNTNIARATQYHSHSNYQFQMAQDAFEQFDFQAKEHILNIGCRAGKVAHYYAQKLPEGFVVGIDPSQDMIDFAKNEYGNVGNLRFEVGTIAASPFTQQFDIACSFYHLHWLARDERQKAFDGIFQSLKSGGQAVLYISCEGAMYTVWKKCIQLVLEKHPEWQSTIAQERMEPVEAWLAYARNAGFSIEHHSTFEKTKIFKTKTEFKTHIKILDITTLSGHERDQFFDESVDLFYDHYGLKESDSLEFSPRTLVLHVAKR